MPTLESQNDQHSEEVGFSFLQPTESETVIVTEETSKVVSETPEEERERLRFVHGGSNFQPGAGMASAKGFLAAMAVIGIFVGIAYLANLILQI